MLRKVTGTHGQYYVDMYNKVHGLYKSRRYSDTKEWNFYHFYADDVNITAEIEALVDDISNITDEEKLMLTLKYGSDFGSTL